MEFFFRLVFFLILDFLILLVWVNPEIWKKFTGEIFLGFLILVAILWLRLWRIRWPKEWADLLALPLAYTGSTMFMFTIFLVLALNIYGAIWVPGVRENSWIRKIKTPLQWSLWFWQSPSKIFPVFWEQKREKARIEKVLLGFMHFFLHRIEMPWVLRPFVFLFHVLPKFLVSWIFVVEIVVFQELVIFYGWVWILFVPLLLRALMHILKEVARKRLKDLDQHLRVVTIYDYLNYGRASFQLPPRDENLSQELFNEYTEQWNTAKQFLGYALWHETVRDYHLRVANVLIFYHYSLGWSSLVWAQILGLWEKA